MGGAKIKCGHESLLSIQLGCLQSKALNIGIMLKKFSKQVGFLMALSLYEFFGFTKIIAIISWLAIRNC